MMNKTLELTGIIGYPITPFSDVTGAVNILQLQNIIDGLISSGSIAIAALGSAGEGAYLDTAEWEETALATIHHVAGRVPVIIGIAELTTSDAVARAVFSDKAGAKAVMVSPMSYYKLSEDEIFDHYQAISDAISVPIMVYNNPSTSGIDMSPEFMCKMVNSITNVTMVKESSGDIRRMHKLHMLSNGTLPFYNGCNYLALEAINAGAKGWCSAAPILIGDLPKQLFDSIKSGDNDKARRLFYQQITFLEFIVKQGLAASIKVGLKLQGTDVGLPRLPLKDLPAREHVVLRRILVELNRFN
ncbi:dihydrodipicolinate synthase family protein [Shewanella sp.]|uniref:dihydrodipicolinate synthase family protein n=1 Tax=Shewanella sp. TaxID=50422 RepID=UPI002582C656|nr:dihydrodipicolinate synthase family protein [Shewanella sp.]MCJ8302987.1 dihydrodipicolinate synthase family protein [Shewanella sp.]